VSTLAQANVDPRQLSLKLGPVDAKFEELLIRAFIVPDKRERYVSRLGLPKARQKFMNDHFFHMRDLDARFAKRIASSDQNAAAIYAKLREEGAPETCYVMSGSSDLDGEVSDLRETLVRVVDEGYDGTFVSCIPGRLAYFDGEEPGERYILSRRED
jgi:hypothetical protein